MIHSYELPYNPEVPGWHQVTSALSSASAAYETASYSGYLTKQAVNAYLDALKMAADHVQSLPFVDYDAPPGVVDNSPDEPEIPWIPVYEEVPPNDESIPVTEEMTPEGEEETLDKPDEIPGVDKPVDNPVDNSEEAHPEPDKPARRHRKKSQE